MTKAWLVVAGIASLAAVGSYSLLQFDWSPARLTFACPDVFANPPTLEAPEGPEAPFEVKVSLQESRPAAVAQHQIIDANGFGWVLHGLPADGPEVLMLQLPRVRATHTVRTVLLAPDEAKRAEAVRDAARSFDLRAWMGLRGWLEPAAVACAVIEVPQ